MFFVMISQAPRSGQVGWSAASDVSKRQVVTVLSRPSQPLALAGYGMIGAVEGANAALDKVFGPRGLHFHLITVPEGQAGLAADTALYLGSEAGRRLRSGRLDLG